MTAKPVLAYLHNNIDDVRVSDFRMNFGLNISMKIKQLIHANVFNSICTKLCIYTKFIAKIT